MTNIEYNFSFIKTDKLLLDSSAKIIHNKNSRKNRIKLSKLEYEEIEIIWTLFECKEEKVYGEFDFQHQSSRDKLSNGIKASQILQTLNSVNVFQNYTPKQDDYLSIRLDYIHPTKNKNNRPYIGEYISFIFTDCWNLNKGYDRINNCHEILFEGVVLIDNL